MNAAVRIRQYAAAGDSAFAVRTGGAILRAKIRNSRTVLKRLAANRGLSDNPVVLTACARLDAAAGEVGVAADAVALRGVEGVASAVYFGELKRFFPAEFPFDGRSRRPPGDPANALLSFAYSVFLGEVESAVRAHGLDPGAGVLHAARSNRPALALDLVEPFRPAFCDLLVLNILNHGILAHDDFEVSGEDGGTYLAKSGRAKFFAAYEAAAARKFADHQAGGRQSDIRQVADRCVLEYARALQGGGQPEFFLLRQ